MELLNDKKEYIMDSHMEIIKQLVDSITSQLTSMLMKIESLKPTLDRLHEDIVDDTELDQSTLSSVKEIGIKINDYKEILSNLPRTIERIESIETELTNMKTDLTTNLNDVINKLEPVYEVNSFLAKVKKHILWIIAFLFATPSALSYIIAWVKDYFFK